MSIFDIFKKQRPMATTVSSVFSRTGAVKAQSGDYTTDLVPENKNLYYTDSRSRAALSASGNLNYDKTTGVFSYSTPLSLPPSGLANGDLSGSYPSPLVKWPNGYGVYDKRYQLSGSLVNVPTTLPPSGPAGGDLSGSYPNPLVKWQNGFTAYDGRYQLSGSLVNWADGYTSYDRRYQLSGSNPTTIITSSVNWTDGYTTYDNRYQLISTGSTNISNNPCFDVLTIFTSNCNSQVAGKVTDYLSVNEGTSGNTIISKAIIMPSSGYIKNMFVLASGLQPLDGSLTITLMKGSLISAMSATALSVTISAGLDAKAGTPYSNTLSSIAVKAGDIIVISRNNNSSLASLTINSISLVITNN